MKKFLAILMAAAMLLSLCACGGGKEENPDVSDATAVAEDENKPVKEDDGKKDDKGSSKAKKVTTIKKNVYASNSGYIYDDYDKDLEGLISYDGSTDTGAKYYDIEYKKGIYYAAQLNPLDTEDNIDAINNTILIDCFGKEIISERYALIDVLSDKYASVMKVLNKVDSKDEANFYLTSNLFSLEPTEDDVFYFGEQYVYDLTTGQKIEGIVSTDGADMSAYGDIIHYRVNGEWKYVNSKGEAIPEDAYDISNLDGHYTMKENDVVTVYDAFGNAVFVCNEDDYVPFMVDNGYFICRNNSTNKVAVFDKEGTMVSAEYDKATSAAIHGDFVELYSSNSTKIYDFKGNLVTEIGKIVSIHVNENNPGYYFLTTTDDDMIIWDKDGNVVFEVEGDETYDYTGCLAYKEVDGEEYFFCLKDKDFTLKGEDIYETNYVVVENNDESFEIVDTVTGKTVLDGKGDSYDVDGLVIGEDVYFAVEVEDGVYDIYKI